MSVALVAGNFDRRPWFAVPEVAQARLEAIQWVAFLFMVIDHVGAFLFQEAVWMRGVGRLAFPLFGMVFAWRLADSLERNKNKRLFPMARRLTLSGILAHGAFAIITMSWYMPEVNIMFAFVVALAIVTLTLEKRDFFGLSWPVRIAMASVILQFTSSRVDYNGWGILFIVSLFSYFRWGNLEGLLGAVAMLAMLTYRNDVHLAILALPVAIALIKIPRPLLQVGKPYPLLFYWLYPLHLFAILAVAIVLIIKTHK